MCVVACDDHTFSCSKVDILWLQGNREEAIRQSRLSRKWNIAAMVTGAVIYVISMAIFVGYVGAILVYTYTCTLVIMIMTKTE